MINNSYDSDLPPPPGIPKRFIQEQYLTNPDITDSDLKEYFSKINPEIIGHNLEDIILSILINNFRKNPPRIESIIEKRLPDGRPRYDSPQCQPVFIEYPKGKLWILYYIYIRGAAPYIDWDLAEQDTRVQMVFQSGQFYVSGKLGLNNYEEENIFTTNIERLRFIGRDLINHKYREQGWHPPKEYDSECGNWVIKPVHEGKWGLYLVRPSKKNNSNYLEPWDFCSAPHHYITSTFLDATWSKKIIKSISSN